MEGAELDPQALVTCAPPPRLCPTCPAGASGWEPRGTSAQLPYGKEGCKQRTRGRWRTKAAALGTSLNPRLLTSHPRGWHQAPAPAPTGVAHRAASCPFTPHDSCGAAQATVVSTLHEVLPDHQGPGRHWSAIGQSTPHGRSELRRHVRFRFPFGGCERMCGLEG